MKEAKHPRRKKNESKKQKQDEWDVHHTFRLNLLFKVSERCLVLKLGEPQNLLGNKENAGSAI